MSKKTASQHACPFHNISDDGVSSPRLAFAPSEFSSQRVRLPYLLAAQPFCAGARELEPNASKGD